jgi:hypothetical protein
MLKSNQEQDWIMAQRFFVQLKMNATADSIVTLIKKKFLSGVIAHNEAATKINDEKDAVKRKELFNAWMKKFPPEKFGTDRIQYDYVRLGVGLIYAEAGNSAKAMEYANQIETKFWRGEGWAGISTALKKKGDLENAGLLIRKAIENAESFLNADKNDRGAQFAALGYYSYCGMYADILYQQKNTMKPWHIC